MHKMKQTAEAFNGNSKIAQNPLKDREKELLWMSIRTAGLNGNSNFPGKPLKK